MLHFVARDCNDNQIIDRVNAADISIHDSWIRSPTFPRTCIIVLQLSRLSTRSRTQSHSRIYLFTTWPKGSSFVNHPNQPCDESYCISHLSHAIPRRSRKVQGNIYVYVYVYIFLYPRAKSFACRRLWRNKLWISTLRIRFSDRLCFLASCLARTWLFWPAIRSEAHRNPALLFHVTFSFCNLPYKFDTWIRRTS